MKVFQSIYSYRVLDYQAPVFRLLRLHQVKHTVFHSACKYMLLNGKLFQTNCFCTPDHGFHYEKILSHIPRTYLCERSK